MSNLNKKYILLSYPLAKNTPVYGDTPPVKIVKVKEIVKGDACNTFWLSFSNHAGTHIDAPYHFDEKGKKILDYSIGELVFESPLLLDCPKDPDGMIEIADLQDRTADLKKCDLLLLRCGLFSRRKTKDYYLHNVGIASSTASWLRSNFPNIKVLGIDSLSISSINNKEEGRKAHQNFLCPDENGSQPILLLEDVNLTKDLTKIKKMFVAPLFVDGVDGVPCAVFAEVG